MKVNKKRQRTEVVCRKRIHMLYNLYKITQSVFLDSFFMLLLLYDKH